MPQTMGSGYGWPTSIRSIAPLHGVGGRLLSMVRISLLKSHAGLILDALLAAIKPDKTGGHRLRS
jgi:hypothetical protein